MSNVVRKNDAGMAQSVEHVIGNDEVISSILITSSIKRGLVRQDLFSFFAFFAFVAFSEKNRNISTIYYISVFFDHKLKVDSIKTKFEILNVCSFLRNLYLWSLI